MYEIILVIVPDILSDLDGLEAVIAFASLKLGYESHDFSYKMLKGLWSTGPSAAVSRPDNAKNAHLPSYRREWGDCNEGTISVRSQHSLRTATDTFPVQEDD